MKKIGILSTIFLLVLGLSVFAYVDYGEGSAQQYGSQGNYLGGAEGNFKGYYVLGSGMMAMTGNAVEGADSVPMPVKLEFNKVTKYQGIDFALNRFTFDSTTGSVKEVVLTVDGIPTSVVTDKTKVTPWYNAKITVTNVKTDADIQKNYVALKVSKVATLGKKFTGLSAAKEVSYYDSNAKTTTKIKFVSLKDDNGVMVPVLSVNDKEGKAVPYLVSGAYKYTFDGVDNLEVYAFDTSADSKTINLYIKPVNSKLGAVDTKPKSKKVTLTQNKVVYTLKNLKPTDTIEAFTTTDTKGLKTVTLNLNGDSFVGAKLVTSKGATFNLDLVKDSVKGTDSVQLTCTSNCECLTGC